MAVLLKVRDMKFDFEVDPDDRPDDVAYFYMYLWEKDNYVIKYQITLNSKDVEFVDFSNDDCHLAYAYRGKPLVVVDISETAMMPLEVDHEKVEFVHEWLSEGLK